MKIRVKMTDRAPGGARRILILSGNHLCNNPRVIKEAQLLAEAGGEVIVLGAWLDAQRAERDRRLLIGKPWRFIPVVDFTRQDVSGKWLAFWRRVRRRLACWAYRWTRFSSCWQLGYAAPELLKAAREIGGVLFIAHSEQALWAVRALAGPEGAGAVVGVDIEDWFSEDLPRAARGERPTRLLWKLERWALQYAVFCTCPSEVMADALAQKAGTRRPAVVYNAFPWGERAMIGEGFKDRVDFSVASLHWFSQTLGPGRGLEDLFAALPLVEHDLEVHLRGVEVPGVRKWIAESLPKKCRAQIFIHPVVENSELLSRISEHDIGFAGEQRDVVNADLTISNKILHYLLGGVAVLASDTAGQREVAERAAGAVWMYQAGNPQSLAAALNDLLSSPQRLEKARRAALVAAHGFYCWERASQVLLDQVAIALNEARVRRGEPPPSVPAPQARGEAAAAPPSAVSPRLQLDAEVLEVTDDKGTFGGDRAGDGQTAAGGAVITAAPLTPAAGAGREVPPVELAGRISKPVVEASFEEVLDAVVEGGLESAAVASQRKLAQNEEEIAGEDAGEEDVDELEGGGLHEDELEGEGADVADTAVPEAVAIDHGATQRVGFFGHFLRSLTFPGFALHLRAVGRMRRYWRRGFRRVLDVSTSGGYYAWLAYQSGAEVVSMVESDSEVGLEEAFFTGFKGLDSGRMQFEVLSMEALAADQRVFDEVVCSFGLERMSSDRGAVKQLFRLLRPGGVLHVCVANRAHPRHRERGAAEASLEAGKRAGYTEHELRRLLGQPGFNVEFVEGVGSSGLDVMDRWIGSVYQRLGGMVALMLMPLGYLSLLLGRRNPLRPFCYYAKAAKPAIRR